MGKWRYGLLLFFGVVLRSACSKCLGIFLFALRAVMGVSGNEIRRCISSWISFQCVCLLVWLVGKAMACML